MNLILLCAGYATRLYPLTKDKPKPLLPVNGKPIIEYSLEKIAKYQEIQNVYIITNNRFYGLFCEWQKAYAYQHPIEVINDGTESDDDKLGAIGDLAYVIDKKNIESETLVIAGDNLFDFDLDDFFKLYRDKNALAVIGAFDVEDRELAKQYGILDIDENNKIVSFVEKPRDPPSTFASLALYLFSKEGIHLVNDYIDRGLNKDQPGHYIRWLSENKTIYAVVCRGHWFDIGDFDSYEKANKFYSENT
ncbi:MAG: nucleotidyltransferase family protein [Candidatus Omnitrophica bacterium]|nr:nucleotidyltransferase family protein [Candidatus Omnitrophota bacterium]